MKARISSAMAIVLAMLCPLASQAAQVQSALNADQIGISAQQLLNFTFVTNIALPSAGAKPAGMGNVVAGMHLGTNTDLFAIGTASGPLVNATEFWVRYTLDPTSNSASHTFVQDPNSPWNQIPVSSSEIITGSLWLSVDTATQSIHAYSEQLSQPYLFGWSGQSPTVTDIASSPSGVRTLQQGWSGEPDYQTLAGSNANLSQLSNACVECSFAATLNLAFLELRWNGNSYNLYTSAEGFDQILTSSNTDPYNYGSTHSYALNIAAVPIPETAWLLGSGLIGVAAARCRRQRRI